MEKIRCICLLRDLVRELRTLEATLIESANIDLNEAMIVCALADTCKTSTDLARCIGLLPAHTSKTLASLEAKSLVRRTPGEKDRRLSICELTEQGKECLSELRSLHLDFDKLREYLSAEE